MRIVVSSGKFALETRIQWQPGALFPLENLVAIDTLGGAEVVIPDLLSGSSAAGNVTSASATAVADLFVAVEALHGSVGQNTSATSSLFEASSASHSISGVAVGMHDNQAFSSATVSGSLGDVASAVGNSAVSTAESLTTGAETSDIASLTSDLAATITAFGISSINIDALMADSSADVASAALTAGLVFNIVDALAVFIGDPGSVNINNFNILVEASIAAESAAQTIESMSLLPTSTAISVMQASAQLGLPGLVVLASTVQQVIEDRFSVHLAQNCGVELGINLGLD